MEMMVDVEIDVEVKMEVLGELFGDNFGCVNSLLNDAEGKELLLPADTLSFSSTTNYSAANNLAAATADNNPPTLLRTVKVPLHAEVGDGNFPPVLSIPASFASPTADLHISISPVSQGADTTSLASPPTPLSTSSSSSSSQKKTVFTAKGRQLFPAK